MGKLEKMPSIIQWKVPDNYTDNFGLVDYLCFRQWSTTQVPQQQQHHLSQLYHSPVNSNLTNKSQMKFPLGAVVCTHSAEGSTAMADVWGLRFRVCSQRVLWRSWGGEHESLLLFVCTWNRGNLGRRRTTELISQEELTVPSQVAQCQWRRGRHWWEHAGTLGLHSYLGFKK